MRRALFISSFALVTCAASPTTTTTVPQNATKPVASVTSDVHIEKSAYPNTPRQTTPWTSPKTTLDATFVSATEKLFEQGLADPRDLPYREIEIAVGEPWSGGGLPIKTHGWVFAENKFAVAWNGLVYAIKSAGPAADLHADMQKLFDDDDAARKKSAKNNPDWTYRHFPTTAETFFVATEAPTILKAMLLLRLGESNLAERMWTLIRDPQSKQDPYLDGANDWLWAFYDRGLTAHMRGDDDLALESLRRLPDLSKAVDAECIARKIERGYNAKPNAPYLAFLDGIDDVVLEMHRRASTTQKIVKLDPAGIAALAHLPQADRIQKLIAALDDVSARQMGQPGGVALGEDPIVQALIAEGEPAVESLIAVFENDTRLTRSVQFWRDFSRYRSVLAVYEAAYVALSGILDASFFQAVSTGDHLTARGVEGRREVGKQIRAYWAKWKGVSLDERAYQMLLDDSATADAWLTAANKITQPSNVQIIPSSNVFQSSMTTSLPPGQKPTLRGEALRTKTSPSMSSLFATRFHAMPDPRHACALANAFAAWDPPAALPSVTTFVKGAMRSWATAPEKSAIGACIAELTTARVEAHDATALADYATWITKTDPKDADYNLEQWFAPMIAHATDARIIAAANTLFSAPSPWVPFVSETAGYSLENILDLDLYKLDAFKRHVASKLLDKKNIGTITIKSDGNVELKTAGFTSSQGSSEPRDPLMPPEGTVMPLRVCDEYAAHVSSESAQKSGAPVFKVYWRETDRDAALTKLGAWIKTR